MSFLLFALVGELWSLATPLNGAPDEVAQTIKAAAVVRGQWVGAREPHDRSAFTTVRVPAVFAGFQAADCVRGKPALPAGTCPAYSLSSRVVAADTYVGHYPPLYYLLVGWPSMLATRGSIYLMRALSVIVNSLFLALAVGTAFRWSRSGILIASLAVATTPMTLFLAGVINPSGLEVSAAIAMWTSATVMVLDHPRHPPPGIIAVLTGSACIELLVRGDSPLWVLLCLVVMLPLGWGRFRLRDFFRRQAFRVAAACMALAIGLAGLWLAVGNPLDVAPLGAAPAGASDAELVRLIGGSTGMLLRQMVGVFGYVDTPSPLLTYLCWTALGGSLLTLPLLSGRRRAVAGLAAALTASTVVPFAMIYSTFRHTALLQGRYFLPLTVAIPIVAGAIGTQPGLPGKAAFRWSAAAVILAGVGQVAAAVWALRRYVVGVDGPLLPVTRVAGSWSPPIPAWLIDVGFLLGWAAMTVFLILDQASPRREQHVGAASRAASADLRFP